MGDQAPRVLFIALAEATLDLVRPWASEGSLPTFGQMIENGLSGRLWSRFPLFGPERWGNLVTGQDANHHGRDRGCTGRHLRVASTAWQTAPEHGRTSTRWSVARDGTRGSGRRASGRIGFRCSTDLFSPPRAAYPSRSSRAELSGIELVETAPGCDPGAIPTRGSFRHPKTFRQGEGLSFRSSLHGTKVLGRKIRRVRC